MTKNQETPAYIRSIKYKTEKKKKKPSSLAYKPNLGSNQLENSTSRKFKNFFLRKQNFVEVF